MSCKARCLVLLPAILVVATADPAHAQVTPPPDRDQNWGVATTVTMASAGALELLMPRIFYPEPEVTTGWKARWHVAQLAPIAVLVVLTLGNELVLKPATKDPRPGCDDTNVGGPHCDTYGLPSTHAFGSFAALGQGAAVWFFDMTKWSGGRINAGSFVGNVAVPLVLAAVTDVGRAAGNWESAGQIVAGSVLGLGLGVVAGMTYALVVRPECGYTGNLICW
jgi:hypothetical protein